MVRGPDISTAWGRALFAQRLFAVDPIGIGGVLLAARPGPVLEAWLASTRAALAAGAWRKLPAGIDDARLLGGLNLTETLASGSPVAERGLLAETNGGVLQIGNAELLDAGTVARITSALDQGRIDAQRDGLSISDEARFGLVAISGQANDDETIADALSDRVALHIDLNGLSMREAYASPLSAESLNKARARLPHVLQSDADVTALAEAALQFGIPSLRAALFAVKVARVAAALRGSASVEAEDLETAAALVLAPRATQLPSPPQDDVQPEEPQEPPQSSEQPDAETKDLSQQELTDLVVAAALATLPPDVLRTLKGAGKGDKSRASGRAGIEKRAQSHGRRAGTRRRRGRTGERLAIVETLRAAAPWQTLRRRDRAGTPSAPLRQVEIRPDDLRSFRTIDRTETSTIFVVDASGSSALNRLNEAKGAVELLLSDCYVRRDHVGLIAFRGRTADVLLEPTRSLTRAKRCLSALPGGGGTPMALAIDAALALAVTARKKGRTPTLVFLTDGRANVDRKGQGGREAAERDALIAARRVAAAGVPTLLIDTSPKAQPQGAALAQALRAPYIPLPRARAQTVSDIVRAKLAS